MVLSALPLLIATGCPRDFQCDRLNTQMVAQMGFFDKLSHKSLFMLCSLIDRPFASHLELSTIPQEWGSSWGLGNAERRSGGCPLVGEAHLVLSLSHHLTLRVPHHSSHLATGFGEAL